MQNKYIDYPSKKYTWNKKQTKQINATKLQ